MAEVKTGDIKSKKVKANDLVLVTYTDKSKHHKKGDTSKVHRVAAEKLVEKGFATCPALKKKETGDAPADQL